MSEQKFFVCNHCKNLIGMIYSSGAPITCCGDLMQEIEANTTDAALEKHVPVVQVEGNKVFVQVGSVSHPMTAEHLIEWIYLETEHGGQRKALKPGDAPHAVFCLEDDKPLAVFAYCNLHGLWKSDI